jgi:hypothetical protein
MRPASEAARDFRIQRLSARRTALSEPASRATCTWTQNLLQLMECSSICTPVSSSRPAHPLCRWDPKLGRYPSNSAPHDHGSPDV